MTYYRRREMTDAEWALAGALGVAVGAATFYLARIWLQREPMSNGPPRPAELESELEPELEPEPEARQPEAELEAEVEAPPPEAGLEAPDPEVRLEAPHPEIESEAEGAERPPR